MELIALIVASVLALVGTALLWAATKKANLPGDIISLSQYENIAFVFAIIAGWLHYLSATKDVAGRAAWRSFFFGLFMFVSYVSVNSWEATDDVRDQVKQKVDGTYMLSDAKKLLAGRILNYMAILITLATIHGKFAFKFSGTTILFILAIICNLIGSIILWNLSSTKANGDGATRDVSFAICTTLWVTLLVLAGAVWHEHTDGAHSALLFLGLYGVWYLSSGFFNNYSLSNTTDPKSWRDRAWAGALFCWFSAWLALVTARFAIAGKASPSAAPPSSDAPPPAYADASTA